MLNAQQSGLPQPTKTWIVLANRSEARIFESDGGTKNLHLLREIPHPSGRLKNRELETDHNGMTMAEGGADYQVGGMVNRDRAIFHEMQIFVRRLADVLNKARAENQFERLILVAERRFLGELRASLDSVTSKHVQAELDKEWIGVTEKDLRSKLGETLLAT